MISERVWKLLACPHCNAPLEKTGDGAACTACGEKYQATADQLDLRLRTPKHVVVPVVVGMQDRHEERADRIGPMPRNPSTPLAVDDLDYTTHAVSRGNGLTPALVSWFPAAGPEGGVALDLGCGQRRRVEPALRLTGFEYVGLDIHGAGPQILGEAGALPFLDRSLDFVFGLGVLAHTPMPYVATREIARVLRPGGTFIGTTQFIEPCHMASRHHVTLLGLLDWLDAAELDVQHVEPNARWSGMRALLTMNYTPRTPERVAGAIAAIPDALGRWRSRHMKRPPRLGEGWPEGFTGGFRWVARRPA